MANALNFPEMGEKKESLTCSPLQECANIFGQLSDCCRSSWNIHKQQNRREGQHFLLPDSLPVVRVDGLVFFPFVLSRSLINRPHRIFSFSISYLLVWSKLYDNSVWYRSMMMIIIIITTTTMITITMTIMIIKPTSFYTNHSDLWVERKISEKLHFRRLKGLCHGSPVHFV